VVSLTLKEGRPGIEDFNELAAECSAMGPGCPTGQLAVVVGDEVVSAPTVQAPSFARDEIQISGSFTKQEAEDLAERIG
jgi:preprotein translocase subunit SecD